MSVEDENVDAVGATASPLSHFGAEVRLERERLGMSRAELGKEACCGYSLVAKIESGDRVPALDFAETCDRVFPHAGGRFVRLWPLALRYAFPPWFRRYVELEWSATAVRMFHPLLLPGIVQTEAYAREVLRTGRPTNLDHLVSARMERQRILTRDDPPRLWIVLDEGVLRRAVGGSDVMCGQLERLRALADSPPHVVQIIPSSIAVYPGSGSPFGLLSFEEGPDVVHVDGFPKGYVLAESEDVASATSAYDLLAATALPPDESAPLIDSILKDHFS
ncbi:helix-turn-helix domain-containing protein [Streptomyces montanisoli]|uniref:Helix-turn-helix domain-containing protein n=1 Tax=Streptomyces montanisoli TaxID=2798581 RepID=A0A940MFP7_9ACTN|nr:helix-turn-helix transcriptional regulator [Streptomyces montanisoli]MBP0460232.1 helix-turn-helix domain-containing protein [Streptomyces montanisoli]